MSDAAAPAAEPDLIEVENLGKRFDIYPNDRSRFFEFFGSRHHHTEHWALRNVNFRIGPGRAFGVIGSNGAGKSTLLRLISGITEPTEGSLTSRGRLATLLDLGVGFHGHFTGRENIQLNCSLLGMPAELIESRIPEIIQFAELGDFIDYPVRTYSAGMNLRLGFAIATHIDADVLVVDEVLTVGDQYFQRKCVRRIERALEEGVSLMLVSHDLHAIRSLCHEVMWLERGRIKAIGTPREVIESYLEMDRIRTATARPPTPPRPVVTTTPEGASRMVTLPNQRLLEDDNQVQETVAWACALEDAPSLFEEEPGEAPRRQDGELLLVSGTGEARILRVQLLDAHGRDRERLRNGESLVVAVTFRTTEPLTDPIFGVAIFRSDGTYVFGPNTRWDGVLNGTWHGVYTFFIHYPRLPLLAGTYRISVAIFDTGHVRPHVWHNQLYSFEVVQEVEDHGLVQLPHRWGMIVHHDARKK